DVGDSPFVDVSDVRSGAGSLHVKFFEFSVVQECDAALFAFADVNQHFFCHEFGRQKADGSRRKRERFWRSTLSAYCILPTAYSSKCLWDDLPRLVAQEVHHLSFAVKAHHLARHRARMFQGG